MLNFWVREDGNAVAFTLLVSNHLLCLRFGRLVLHWLLRQVVTDNTAAGSPTTA